jgi:hypothetical protein
MEFVVAVIVFIVFYGLYKWSNQPTPVEDSLFALSLKQSSNFKYDKILTSEYGFDGAAVNTTERKILFGTVKKGKLDFVITNFDDVISAELVVDGQSSGTSKILGGAVALGTAGALLGAIAGNSIKSVVIKVTLNNIEKPLAKVTLLNHQISKNSKEYQKVIESGDQLLALLNVIIKQGHAKQND